MAKAKILIREKDHAILEYRPRKYVSIHHGKVTGKIAQDELDEQVGQILKEKFGDIDPGIIEVSLALAAVSAILSTSVEDIFFRLLGLAAFALSSFSAGRLYFSYLITKSPHIYLIWPRGMFARYIQLFLNMNTGKDSQKAENEFALLSLLLAFALAWIATAAWIISSFVVQS
jgi:hypothetical protein